VREAGFTGLYVQKLGEGANFKHDGVQMRELLLVAYKPALADPQEEVHHVVYRGPFREVADDQGVRYPRGERVAVDPAIVARLRQGPLSDQFFFLKGTGP
jgi:hypothetical protein